MLRADADDRVLDRRRGRQVAAFGDDRCRATVQSSRRAPRQKARVREDRPVRIVELERRAGLRQHDVGVVERRDGADVGPVAAKQVGAARCSGRAPAGMTSRPKSRWRPRVEQLEQHIAREDVDAHRGDERLVAGCAAERRAGRHAAADLAPAARASASPRTRRSGRSRSNRKMPIADASSIVTGCAAIVMSASRSTCASTSSRVVHPVEMIAGENQVVVGVVAHEVARRLAHGVGRALEPVRVVGRLLGRQDLDEALAEQIDAGRSARCAG